MLISIVSTCFLLIGFLAFREWVKCKHLSKRAVSKIFRQAEKEIALEQWAHAEQRLRSLYENGFAEKQTWLLYTKVLIKMHRYDEAFRWIAYGLHKYPEELSLKLEEAKTLVHLRRFPEALDAFEKSRSILKNEADFLLLAIAFFHLRKFEELLEVLHPFLEDTNNSKLLTLHADTLSELNRHEEAIPIYLAAIQLGEKSHHLCIQLAHAYRKIGDYQKAEALFRQILTKDPHDIPATLGWGACLEARNFYQKALLVYRSGKAWNRGETSLIKQAGKCALYVSDFVFAQQCFEYLLSKDFLTPEILSFFCYSLECQQKWEEAEQCYLKLIHQFPQYANGYLALAWLYGVGYSCKMSHEQGLYWAHKGIELNPTPLAWEILSACEARGGNFNYALQIQEYLHATAIDKRDKARNQLAIKLLRGKIPLSDHHISRTRVA